MPQRLLNLKPRAIRSLPEELPAPVEFREPPPGYGPVPFWFWNARMDEAEVRRQVREMHEKGCSGAFLHARHGLQTPYLSEEWFACVRAAVAEAAECGFQIWLYDEDNWPSGTAGGAVTAGHPEYRARALHVLELSPGDEPVLPEGEILGAWAVPDGLQMSDCRLQIAEPAGQSAIANLPPLIPIPGGNPKSEIRNPRSQRLFVFTARDAGYVDVLNAEATARFLGFTHDRYAEAVGEHFGRTVPGVFMDEATLVSIWDVPDRRALPWSHHFAEEFRRRNGYDLLEVLPALVLPLPGADRVRCDYFATLSELYVNGFFRPIQEWCAAHAIASTGHLLMEEPLAPQVRHQADGPAAYRFLDIPGVDNLTVRIGGLHHRLAASVAHQQHKSRVLSETFGAAGWGATLAQRKASADWQLANGINLFVPHAVYYSVYGKRKRENPPSEFEQEPFWPHYRQFADTLTRLSFLLTRGKHGARVAVFYPLRSAWAHLYPGYERPGADEAARTAFAGCGSPDRLLLGRMESDLLALCELLTALHFDFDFVDEAGLAEARIEKSRLCLGPERFELLILPSMTTCAPQTWSRVRAFFDAGGNVLSCGLLPFQTGEGAEEDIALRAEVQALSTLDPTQPDRPGGRPPRALGRAALRPRNVDREHGSRVARYVPGRVPDPEQRALLMKTLLRTLVAIDVDLDAPEVLCHQRETSDGKLFFLVNSADAPREVRATFYALGHPEDWDPESGEVRRLWQYARAGEKVTLPLTFAPRQSRVIVFSGRDEARAERANFQVEKVTQAEDHYLVEGYAFTHDRPMDTPPNCSLAWPGGARWAEGLDQGLLEPIVLGDIWDLRVLGDNILVLPDWRYHVPQPGQDPAALSAFQEHWPELPRREPITWFPNLEPLERALPDEVWFQTTFRLDSPPRALSLLLEPLDVPYTILVNGHEVMPLQTGVLDPQFLTADIADVVVEGVNVAALRLSMAGARAPQPDNLHRITCDLVPEPARLLGDFTALAEEDGGFLVYAGSPQQIATGSWAEQGFPHLSGTLEYSQPVSVGVDYFDFRLMLTCDAPADLVQVLVNGELAGTRLWAPYSVDISQHLFAGTNTITLRVTNSAVNALLGQTRPSGVLGPVRIEPYARFAVKVPV